MAARLSQGRAVARGRPARGHGRPPGRPAVALLVAGIILAGCGIGAQPASLTPQPVPSQPADQSPAIAATRAELARALGDAGLLLDDPTVEYRPPEPPVLADVPRSVFRAVLPADPKGGNIVVYEFTTTPDAAAAGADYASWLASGPGAVYFPPDTRFTLRQVGSTVVFFSWSPANSPDPQTPDIAPALETVGVEIPIPA